MIIKTKDLKLAFSALNKIVNGRYLPILGSIRIFCNGSNVLELTGTNLEEQITFKIECLNTNNIKLDCCVPLDDLKLAIEPNADTTIFSLSGMDLVTFCFTDTILKNHFPSEEFPSLADHGLGSTIPLCGRFYDNLSLLNKVKAKNDIRAVYNCVNISKDGFCCVDGHQMLFIPDAVNTDEEINMPVTALNASLYKLAKYPMQFFAYKKVIKISSLNFDYYVKRVDNKFPCYQQAIPNISRMSCTISIKGDAVKQARKFLDKYKPSENIKLFIKLGKLTLTGKDNEFIEVDAEGATLSSDFFLKVKHFGLMLTNGFTTWYTDDVFVNTPVISKNKENLEYIVMKPR